MIAMIITRSGTLDRAALPEMRAMPIGPSSDSADICPTTKRRKNVMGSLSVVLRRSAERMLKDSPFNFLALGEHCAGNARMLGTRLGQFQHTLAAAMSSMQAELAGGIAAACADGPVHIASDNMGFVKRLNQILSDPAAHPHKSCGLLSDGDLWEQLHSIIVSKGSHSIKASWTKGHITEQQVNEGRNARAAKICNDLAGTMADVGAEGFGLPVQVVAKAWAHRQGAYAKLERRILRRLANVIKADASKREHLAKAQALLRKDRPQSLQQVAEELPYACSEAAATLDAMAATRRPAPAPPGGPRPLFEKHAHERATQELLQSTIN